MISKILQGLVRLYQITLSPYWGAQCRFYPTCSCYAIDALKQHGAIKGTYLAVNRICRCNPWAKGGIDPVPEKVIKK
jgi:putative membrane protein insertion efficiency factor